LSFIATLRLLRIDAKPARANKELLLSLRTSNPTPEPVPAPVTYVAGIMSNFPAHWCLCGGWAVDAWLGHQTREHGDIDISVFEDDQRALFDHLNGWHLIAHDAVEPNAGQPWDGRRLATPAHIHAGLSQDAVLAWVADPRAPAPGDMPRLEVDIDLRSGDEWVLRRDPRIALPLQRAVGRSSWGLPTAVPEVLLFFKGTAFFGSSEWKRPRDDADFVALQPFLDAEQREWLREAITCVLPDHPWLEQLSG
jgi:hypothetical protein